MPDASAPVPSSAAASSSKAPITSTDVGWQFVPQYYTFVNKHPQRLHCFYTKNSTFIHGTEGEDGVPCSGQQEIHEKILSIGFNDCKVYIHSVDSQPSAGGGIIIQVIGEMSNDGGPWRKFAQTFFLAEQPNGYFVLNDIFRFLKEDTVADDEDVDESAAPVDEATAAAPAVEQAEAVTIAPEVEAAAPEAVVEAGAKAAEATAEAAAPEPEAAPEAPVETVKEQETPAPAAAEEKKEEVKPAAVEAPAAAAPVAEEKKVEEKAAAPAAAPPAPKAEPTPAAPAAPAAPKTWASMARGAASSSSTAAAAAPSPPAPAPAAPAPAPAAPKEAAQQQSKEQQPSQSQQQTNGKPAGARASPAEAAMAVNTPHCFVKLANWAAERDTPIDPTILRTALEQRFGKVKELEIVKSKACAFLEFAAVDSARRAILASLPVNQGGEGGVKVEGQGRVVVEVRKEKSERGPVRAGGAPGGGGAQNGEKRAPGGGRGGGARGGARGGAQGAGGPGRGGRGGAAAGSK